MKTLKMKNIQKELNCLFNTKQQGAEVREKYLIPFLEENKKEKKLLMDMDGCTGFSNQFLESLVDFNILDILPEEHQLMIKSDDCNRVKFNLSEYNADLWTDNTNNIIKFIRRNSLDIGIIILILTTLFSAFWYYS